MTRSQNRVAVVGGATLVATGCLYLWTQPAIGWDSLQQPLDALQNIRSSFISQSSSCSAQQVLDLPPVELVSMSEDGAQHRLFYAPPPNSPDWSRIQPSLSLPSDCLDAHVSSGAQCGDPDAPTEQFDFVWTWSNGSEALHRRAFLAYEASTLPVGASSQANQMSRLKLFREHDELRHSFRSVLQHFRPHIHKIHLVTGDLPVPVSVSVSVSDGVHGEEPEALEALADATSACQKSATSNSASTTPRLGQVPAWLNTTQEDGDVRIGITHHSQYFTQYNDTVFNSLAIESQFPNLPGLHDHFIYMNDDFFFSADLTAADFYTKSFGTVFRVYPSRVLQPTSERDPHSSPQAAETVALEWTSELLSRRFGFRSRPYPSHESKVVSTPLFRELAGMYPEALADSGRARVRSETGSKVANVHTMALYLHFVVERHREAVLWSWAVGRMTQIARAGAEDWVEAAWREVGGAATKGSVEVRARPRHTLYREHLQAQLGNETGEYAFNAYRFASDDGYPYAALGEKGRGSWPEMRKIDTGKKAHPHYKCTIERRRCFPTRDDLVAGYTPADFFQHIAFVDIECGDCVMTALVAASGELGLSAALPNAVPFDTEMEDPSSTVFDQPPHLPLVDNFFDGDFSVDAVMPRGGDLRAFSVQLIHRYRYVLGRIFSGFSMLKDPQQAEKEFARLDKDINKGSIGVVCINDDIVKGAEEVDDRFRAWQEAKWPTAAAWEKF